MFNDVYQPHINTKQLSAEQRAKMAVIDNTSGFGYMDLETLLKDPSKETPLIPIMSAVVGVNSLISYSSTNEKMVAMQGFNRLKILPILHRNLI